MHPKLIPGLAISALKLVMGPAARISAKAGLYVHQLSEDLKCSRGRALFYLLTKWTLPYFHFHPVDGLVFHTTWKHHIVYFVWQLREVHFLYAAIFVCDWSQLGGDKSLNQLIAVLASAFIVLHSAILYMINFRRQCITLLCTMLLQYDLKLAEAFQSRLQDLNSTSNVFISLMRPPRKILIVFLVLAFMVYMAAFTAAIAYMCFLFIDIEIILSPFQFLFSEHPILCVMAEISYTLPAVLVVCLSMPQIAMPIFYCCLVLGNAMEHFRTIFKEKMSCELMHELINHYNIWVRFNAVCNELVNPCVIPMLRSAGIAIIVPIHLLVFNWYSEQATKVNWFLIITAFFAYFGCLSYIYSVFKRMGDVRSWATQFRKRLKHRSFEVLIETNCDIIAKVQIRYLQRRIRSLQEVCINTSNFGKISSMAEIKILEEIADYTITALLLTK